MLALIKFLSLAHKIQKVQAHKALNITVKTYVDGIRSSTEFRTTHPHYIK